MLPLDWQRAASKIILSPDKEKLLAIYGGIGVGKSLWIAQITYLVAMTRPGARIVVSADTLTRLTRNNKPHCDAVYGLDAEYRGNPLNRYDFSNGSTVTFIGYQVPSGADESYNPWEGMDIHLLIVDEIQQLPEACFGHSFGRARFPRKDYAGVRHPAKIVWCGRPGAIDHWIKEADRMQEKGIKSKVLRPMTKDNPHNGPEYLQGLKAQYSDAEFKCLTEGAPMPVTGAIYSDWSSESFPTGNILTSYIIDKNAPTSLGLDFGRTSPAVVFLQETERNGQKLDVIVDEIRGEEMLTPDLVKAVLDKGYNLTECFVDPAGSVRNIHSGISDIDLLRRPRGFNDPLLGGGLGIPVISTRDSTRVPILAGISRVRAMIKNGEGIRRLVAAESFWEASKSVKGGFYQSILQYHMGSNGAPVKGGTGGGVDHIVDALRYWVINKRWTLEQAITIPQMKQIDTKEVIESRANNRTNTFVKGIAQQRNKRGIF